MLFRSDLFFNQLKVKRVSTQKHLGVILDEKLNFNAHLKTVFDKSTKCIGILRKTFFLFLVIHLLQYINHPFHLRLIMQILFMINPVLNLF